MNDYKDIRESNDPKEILHKIANIIQNLEQVLKNIEDLNDECYIVECQDVPVKFIEESRYSFSFTGVTNASRFTKERAIYMAKRVRNGNGEYGEAIHIKDSLQRNIQILSAALEVKNGQTCWQGGRLAQISVLPGNSGDVLQPQRPQEGRVLMGKPSTLPEPWYSLMLKFGSVAELAEALRTNPRTLYRWAHTKHLPIPAAQTAINLVFRTNDLTGPY
jgi:hypothetical protein